MFAGHVGAGLALGRTSRRLNVGILIFAALLLDVLLWIFVTCGIEHAYVPPDFAVHHYLRFTFPWSHGLAASLLWAAAAGAGAWACARSWAAARTSAALAIFAAVLSHWVLDVLVHAPEMPLAGGASSKVGLGLWDHRAIALALELTITFAGLGLYLAGSGLSRGRAAALSMLVIAIAALTIGGMTVAPPPTDVRGQALGALTSICVLALLCGWLDGSKPRPGRSTTPASGSAGG